MKKKTKKKTLIKPKPKKIEQLSYHDVIDYIEKKYNINTRDYARKFSAIIKDDDLVPPILAYLDFWRWVIDCNDVSNPCYISLPVDEDEIIYESANQQWVKEILTYIAKEFGEYADGGFLELWVEW